MDQEGSVQCKARKSEVLSLTFLQEFFGETERKISRAMFLFWFLCPLLSMAEVDREGEGGSDEKRKLSVLLLCVVHSFHC